MQGNPLNLHTPLTSRVGLKGQILKGVCYDLNDSEGELQVKINGIYVL